MTATVLQKRFIAMDGLRGIAALYVLMFHAGEWFPKSWTSRGWLSVDLFFVLSGFVIAASYEQRLANYLHPFDFFKLRIIRLYPLYLIGLLVGIINLVSSYLVTTQITDLNLIRWHALPFSFLMLPYPFADSVKVGLYPLNGPAWSLFFEVIINIIYSFTFRYWTKINICFVILLSGFLFLHLQALAGEGEGGIGRALQMG